MKQYFCFMDLVSFIQDLDYTPENKNRILDGLESFWDSFFSHKWEYTIYFTIEASANTPTVTITAFRELADVKIALDKGY